MVETQTMGRRKKQYTNRKLENSAVTVVIAVSPIIRVC